MKYITKDSTIIFDPSYDEELDPGLLTNYKKIIFSNYILEDDFFEMYENNKINIFSYSRSKFNHPVNHIIPSSITHLTFSLKFNQSVDYLPFSIQVLIFGSDFNHPVSHLPSSITHLSFCFSFNQPISALPSSIRNLTFHSDSKFNHELNNLPMNLEFIELPLGYTNRITNIPPNLRKIVCSVKYKFINDFYDFNNFL